MARPLRLEYAGALYHVTARGDRREDIFFRDEDRTEFFSVLGEVCERFNWIVHAYCQINAGMESFCGTVGGQLGQMSNFPKSASNVAHRLHIFHKHIVGTDFARERVP
ncbi:MAG: hypothetical protein H6R26_431 [Proteobacteria bacterium]|nr:hypothetical protein [Pseudomonadota bacterium]